MAKKNELGITVSKRDDIAEWYSQVVLKSELADYSAVKGCAVIRPDGYAIWQSIMDYFNARLRELDVRNAYFPLLIPERFFLKEAEHVEGFAPELAWIEQKDDAERVAIRPTSESIMYDSYAKWIRSHRDLPLKINQWANVMRWEVSDVKLFLRSREFLWQEGHCAFATDEEAATDAETMIREYKRLSEELLAVPAVIGLKSQHEKFPGARFTYTIESFMPDGKALQAGTTHHLGQGFSKAFDITFKGTDEQDHYPYQTSWGFSTRLLGSLVMMHSDDRGLVLPPRVAPVQLVIIPITIKKKPELSEQVMEKARAIASELQMAGIRVTLDDTEQSPGFKFGHWELKGVPLRLEIGPRDLENEAVLLAKRTGGEKEQIAFKDITAKVTTTLNIIQDEMLATARAEMQARKIETNDYGELVDATTKQGKYALAPHCGEAACEEAIKAETGGVTTRCRPIDNDKTDEPCVKCGKDGAYKIIFSRNY